MDKYLHTKFHQNRPIGKGSSFVHIHTDTQKQTTRKNHMFGCRDHQNEYLHWQLNFDSFDDNNTFSL